MSDTPRQQLRRPTLKHLRDWDDQLRLAIGKDALFTPLNDRILAERFNVDRMTCRGFVARVRHCGDTPLATRALDVARLLNHEGASLQRAADALGVHKSALFRFLELFRKKTGTDLRDYAASAPTHYRSHTE